MHNLHIDQWRREGRITSMPDEALPALAVRATQDDGLALRDLDRALAKLPLDQREVLLLVTLEGLTYAETARTLGVAQGTVMSRLSRARSALRAALAGETATHLKVVER